MERKLDKKQAFGELQKDSFSIRIKAPLKKIFWGEWEIPLLTWCTKLVRLYTRVAILYYILLERKGERKIYYVEGLGWRCLVSELSRHVFLKVNNSPFFHYFPKAQHKTKGNCHIQWIIRTISLKIMKKNKLHSICQAIKFLELCCFKSLS